MTSPPESATVLNTTVLSNFAQVERVDLLLSLPRLVTVARVKEELEAGVETHPYIENALVVLDSDIPIITPSESVEELEGRLLKTLDPGEAQAVAVAESTNGMIVTDDGDARVIAKQRGVDVTGSIGLLVRFIEDGQLTPQTADGFLKKWIDEAGFRSPARDIEAFLEG